MSIKAMGWVWDSELEPTEKFILLALADHADHEGGNMYPSLRTIAQKTGYTQRTVRLIVSTLRKRGIIYVQKPPHSERLTFTYAIDPGKLGGESRSGGEESDSGGGGITIRGGRNLIPGGEESRSSKPSFNRPLDSLINQKAKPQQAKSNQTLKQNALKDWLKGK